MKIRSLTKLTRTYALALSMIALLTLATSITMHQVILTQMDSARLVNISGSQRFLAQKAALLSAGLIYDSNPELFRQKLLNNRANTRKSS